VIAVQIGLIGMGRMGANMTLRLLEGGHEVVIWDRNPPKVEEMKRHGATPSTGVEDLVSQLKPPRHVWLMVPAGDPVDKMIETVAPLLDKGDAVIDGGNSNWQDSVRRADALQAKGIYYMDVGTSGGIWGLKIGYCLMIGGSAEAFRRLEPVFKTLAPENGYLHVGPSGSGHYVKMIHNGIEYGLLQAYAEGFEILHAAPYDIDLKAVARLWKHGSVVRSWLLELVESALEKDPNLSSITGYVADSGMGRWTVMEAIERDVPATALAHALFSRFRSRQEDSFGARLIAALRREFGGHPVKTE
jgi:6-phosphogluconate dehydrogenase